jgi:NADH:ubiquinone oxidoreductase subunit 6 (subunit J)
MKALYLLAVYVHIVTVAVWFGAMLFEDPASVRIMSRMAYKIHGIGGPSLLLLILTGAFMLSYRGVTWQNIISGEFYATSYGQAFGLKFLLVFLLIGFQVTIGNKPSKLSNYGYLLVTLAIIALSVWLVRPII